MAVSAVIPATRFRHRPAGGNRHPSGHIFTHRHAFISRRGGVHRRARDGRRKRQCQCFSRSGIGQRRCDAREAVPCASTALPVTQSLRDLWFRPPDTLRISTTWEDSSSYVVCRDGIPLRATVHRTFRITGTAERNGRLLLTIARQSRTTIEGNGAQFGEAVAVSGAGSGQLAYDFDPASGEVLGATGNATLDFSLRSRLRTQIVRQTVEIRIGRS